MDIGIIGLGRMGANIARRLMRAGHRAVVFDRDPAAVKSGGGAWRHCRRLRLGRDREAQLRPVPSG